MKSFLAVVVTALFTPSLAGPLDGFLLPPPGAKHDEDDFLPPGLFPPVIEIPPPQPIPALVQAELNRCGSDVGQQVFDTHLHLATWFSQPEPLLDEMASSGIGGGIIMAVYGPTNPFGTDPNEEIAKFLLNDSNNERLFGLASLNTTGDWTQVADVELERLSTYLEKPGFVGAKIAPPHTRLPLNSTILQQVIRTISISSQPRLGIHIGTTPFCGAFGDFILGQRGLCDPQYVDPYYLEPYIQEFPQVTFVLMHGGQDFIQPNDADKIPFYNGTNVEHSVDLASRYENVYIEISASLDRNEETFVYENPLALQNLKRIVRGSVQHKTFYGSDANAFPGRLLGYLNSTVVSLIDAGFTEEERCQVLVTTPREAYGISASNVVVDDDIFDDNVDDDNDNDDVPPEDEESKVRVRIDLVTDSYPAETSWTIKNEAGQVVKEWWGDRDTGDPESLIQFFVVLDAGAAYVFEILDRFGDGICCGPYGNGSVKVIAYRSSSEEIVLVESDGDFGSSFRAEFMAPTRVADDDGTDTVDEESVSPTAPTVAPATPATFLPSQATAPIVQPVSAPVVAPESQPVTFPSSQTASPVVQPVPAPVFQPVTIPTETTNAPVIDQSIVIEPETVDQPGEYEFTISGYGFPQSQGFLLACPGAEGNLDVIANSDPATICTIMDAIRYTPDDEGSWTVVARFEIPDVGLVLVGGFSGSAAVISVGSIEGSPATLSPATTSPVSGTPVSTPATAAPFSIEESPTVQVSLPPIAPSPTGIPETPVPSSISPAPASLKTASPVVIPASPAPSAISSITASPVTSAPIDTQESPFPSSASPISASPVTSFPASPLTSSPIAASPAASFPAGALTDTPSSTSPVSIAPATASPVTLPLAPNPSSTSPDAVSPIAVSPVNSSPVVDPMSPALVSDAPISDVPTTVPPSTIAPTATQLTASPNASSPVASPEGAECVDTADTTFLVNTLLGEKDCVWLSQNMDRFGYLCQFVDVAFKCLETCDTCVYLDP